jgi:hypothetical protein
MALPPGRKPLSNDWFLQQTFPNVTRVEVIDSSGRSYVKYNTSDVSISLQDDERTLKVFLKNGRE